MGYFVKRQKQDIDQYLALPIGPTADRPSVPQNAYMRYNTDTNSIEYFNGTVFVDIAKAGNAVTVVDKLTTDGITDTYTMSVEAVDASRVIVFIDGLYQHPGPTNNYTVSGFNLIFTSIPPSGLEVTVIHGAFGTYVQDSDVFDVPNL